MSTHPAFLAHPCRNCKAPVLERAGYEPIRRGA